MEVPRGFNYPFHINDPVYHPSMAKPRVLLSRSQHLFGESMESLLRASRDVEMIGPWDLKDQDICRRVEAERPSVVVIADEDLQSQASAELTQAMMEHCPELSIIRTGLSQNVFRLFSTSTLPARGDSLIETIRVCIARGPDSPGVQPP